jgi:Ca-activated chloride channel family protein
MTPRDPLDFPWVWPTFAYPTALGLLAVPVLLLIWVWANRWVLPQRRLVLPVDAARSGGGWWLWATVTVAESVPPLLLAVGVLILAGPQRNGPPKEKRSLTNIQFCVDVSGSMMAPYGDAGDRYDASMKAIEAFVDYRKGDAFGLTFFGVEFVHWVPLTSDASAIKCAPPFMRPELAPPGFGGTAIPKAVRGCKKVLIDREDGDRMILLVTDGYDYDVVTEQESLIKELTAANVTLFSVVVADEDPQPELVTICRATGGEAFRAGDPDILKAVFAKIDTMKQAKMLPTMVETIDYFEPFALAGLALTALGTLCLLGLRYTPW